MTKNPRSAWVRIKNDTFSRWESSFQKTMPEWNFRTLNRIPLLDPDFGKNPSPPLVGLIVLIDSHGSKIPHQVPKDLPADVFEVVQEYSDDQGGEGKDMV